MFSPLLQLHGKLRVILEPLIGDVPLVGAITMFFIQRPVSFVYLFCFFFLRNKFSFGLHAAFMSHPEGSTCEVVITSTSCSSDLLSEGFEKTSWSNSVMVL